MVRERATCHKARVVVVRGRSNPSQRTRHVLCRNAAGQAAVARGLLFAISRSSDSLHMVLEMLVDQDRARPRPASRPAPPATSSPAPARPAAASSRDPSAPRSGPTAARSGTKTREDRSHITDHY